MKKYGGLIACALAIGFGVFAVVLANKWLAARNTQATVITQESVPLTEIVIAARDLGIGMPLVGENLTLTKWPKSTVPKGAFYDISKVEGRVAVTKLSAGEPVLAAELAAPGSGAGMVALIKPGMRAMAIRVDEVTGVGGFVLPNTSVDVIGVEARKGDKKIVKTILQKIKVLAIAQETFTEEGKAKVVRTVTLELEPKQTEKLALQTHKGAIHLVLRNPLDETVPPQVAEKKPVRKRQVASLKPRVYAPKPSPHAVEIIRGTTTQKIQFKNVNSEERL